MSPDDPAAGFRDRILIGDALAVLRSVPDGIADACVTSPPYWSLRDYGVAGQLGLEPTPDAYVSALVEVFREVRRVLKPAGTLWLNLGDTFFTAGGRCRNPGGAAHDQHPAGLPPNRGPPVAGLKPKDLVGIPWRVAFALQADGWWLRTDIIWHKPNPMPEPVRDRPARNHEYVFLLAKSRSYFYDADAVMEPVTGNAHARGSGVNPKAWPRSAGWAKGPGSHSVLVHNTTARQPHRAGLARVKQNASFSAAVAGLVSRRNLRTVWTIGSQPFRGPHFAAYPESLVERCIRAGSPAGGLVLDPFCGTGTTLAVARRLGRHFLGIELKPEYVEIARKRVAQVGS